MKLFKQAILTTYVFFIAIAGIAQTFNGTGGTIPAANTALTCFPITVSGLPTAINSSFGLTQICINLAHPVTSEVEILLQAPDGTYIPITLQNGLGANYTNTCFSTSATNPIKFGTSPFTGSFLPEGYLTAANNGQNPNGIWNLCISDRRTAANSGSLTNWSITFANNPGDPPPTFPACSQTLPSSSSCATATPVCDFNGICGNTANNVVQDWTGSGLGGCFGLQNNTFIKFIAAANTVSFSVWVPTTTGTFITGGIQMLFFSGTCGSGAVSTFGCYPHIFPYSNASSPVVYNIIAKGLTIGNSYFLMVDGFGGANSTYRIAANSGINILKVSPDSSTICAGQSVNLTATGGNGTYTWSPSTGLNTNIGSVVTASPAINTTYTVSSATLSGCPLTLDAFVAVNPSITPVTGFSYSTPVCINATNPTPTTVAGFTTGGTFSSTTGLSINATTGEINLAASTPGSYTITYNVAASGCNPAASSTASLVYEASSPTRIVNFSYSKDSFCQQNGSSQIIKALNFTENGIFSSSPPGLILNTTNGTVDLLLSNPGTYVVTYTLAANNCDALLQHTTPIKITASPSMPVVTVLSNTVCGPKQVNITASGSGIIYWYADNGLTNLLNTGITYNPFVSSDTKIFVVAADAGCKSPVKEIQLNYLPLILAPDLGKDTAICPGDKLILNAGNYALYLWQDGSTSPTYDVALSGYYSVTVKDINGCEATAGKAVNVLDNCDDIYFPNSFSPNGDNLNESFGALGNLFLVKKFILQIYNRYGEIVYESNNPYQRWNGGDKNKRLASESYVWQCSYIYKDSKKLKKGQLLLLK